MKTAERRFEHISHFVLEFLLLTLRMYMPAGLRETENVTVIL